MPKPFYKLSYGTHWIWTEEKPSRLKRLYCFWVGSFIALFPFSLIFVIAGIIGALELTEII